MIKLLIYRNVWLGFVSWLIPFAIAFFCYSSDGKLIMEQSTFKSLMVISGAVSASYLLYHFFKVVNSRFILSGFVVGLSWFGINILLDSLILIPIMKISFTTYFMAVGLGYIAIPAISVAMGCLLHKRMNEG